MNRILPWLAAGCAALVAIGCGGTSSPLLGGRSPRVRLVNAVYGTDNLAANFQTSDQTQQISYGAATSYKILDNTNQNVSLTDPNTQAQYAILSNQLYENGLIYTVIGTGNGTAGTSSSLATAFLIADTSSAPAAQYAQLRVVNAARGSEPINVFVAPSGTAFGTVPTRSNLAFGNTDNNAYYSTFQAGLEQIRVTDASTGTVLLNTTITTQSASNYTLVVAFKGSTTAAGYDAFVVQDAPGGGYS